MRREELARLGDEAVPSIPGLRIVRRLGRGGMGAVFLAISPAHGAVALKVMGGETEDPSARERFVREIAAVSAIHNANIVRLLEAGMRNGLPYALFERIRGRTLAQVAPQPWPVVVDLGRQLAGATAAVHAAGWIHRDLKRSNAMVSDRGFVTLIDFGLAKHRAEPADRRRVARVTDPDLTLRGTIIGTPRYLAPETRQGGLATQATDIYALGLMLHELLGGRIAPNGGHGPVPGDVPAPLAALIGGALATEPRQRPTAASVAAALDVLPATRARFRTQLHDAEDTWPSTADGRATVREGHAAPP